MVEDEDEEVQLSEGMAVANPSGEALGKLSALLIEEDEEEAEFLVLHAHGSDRLVPFDAVLGVEDGTLLLDVPAANVGRFPAIAAEAEPTEADMSLAYEVYDEGATEWGEDAEE